MDNKNNPKCIHETVIKDIVDFISNVSDNPKSIIDAVGTSSPTGRMRNIAKATRDLTLTFPVIVTDTVPVETASMISKAIERKAVTMLQMLFSAISITNASNAIDYLKDFHTNLDTDGNLGVDDFIGLANQIATDENSGVDITDKQLYMEAMKSFETFKEYYLNENFSSDGLDRFTVKLGSTVSVTEALTDKDLNKARAAGYRFGVKAGAAEERRKSRAEKGMRDELYRARRDNIMDKRNARLDANSLKSDRYSDTNNISKINKVNVDIASNQSFTTDIKKANELVPSMMVINFITANGKDRMPIGTCAVIGVKARLQYVSSDDGIERIITKNEDKNGLFNFIKATTGQISFWKDFVFAIKRAKIDSIANTHRGSSSPIWKLLEHRAIKSKIHRWTGTTNDASAISTLVISKAEADYLEKEERIKILNPRTAFTIMNAYNLMCFIVVDEALEKAHFLFDDGSNEYEVISFNSLEREDGNGAYKKVINLLTKSR